MKLYINSRDELRIIELDRIVYLRASNNYTEFHFADGQTRTYVSCLSAFERQIADNYDNHSPFVRMGRSYLVNSAYVASINLQHQTIKFNNDEIITLPKKHLRVLKEHLLANMCSLKNMPISENNPAYFGEDSPEDEQK